MVEITPSGVKRVFSAARNGPVEILARYLERGGNINVTDHDGWTLLMHAAVHRQPEVVRFLLQAGAEPESTADEKGMTALTLAQERGYEEIVEILEQAGAMG